MQKRLRRRVNHMLGGEGHQDPWVKAVDAALVTLITLNVVAVVLESVESLSIAHGPVFHAFDRFSVVVFSAEYLLRLWTCVELDDSRYRHPLWGRLRYMTSPMAVIDLMAVLPFYLGMFVEIDLRAMRVLRLLRLFKLTRYSSAMSVLVAVLRKEARAVWAMLFILSVIMIFSASLIYLFEHHAQPHRFADIPSAMWWSIVTLTTLGYGDVTPITPMGRLFAGLIAVIGVGMVALPAGILASGFTEELRVRREEFREKVDDALASGNLTRARRNRLREMRLKLGLDEEEAALILERAVREKALAHCPHCGHDLLAPKGEETNGV